MKKVVPLVLILAIVLLLPSLSHSSTLGAVRVSLIEGDVQIKTDETGEWVAAAINMPLREGDRLWVPEGGRIELQLGDGSSIRLNGNSSFEIMEIGRDSFLFYLTTGHAYVNFKGSKAILLQIDTPVSSIHASERAAFRIDVASESDAEISVFKGMVYTEGRSGNTRVSEGTNLSLRGSTFADLHPLGAPDEWERWNRERDRVLYERRYSYRYLPEELSGYSCDFDRYGKWVYMREYGHVWTPTIYVSFGWAPYRHGRWLWIAGDYVWVSYEPWGWAPYHYGRWIYLASRGWYWVPPHRGAVYWGPGFVGWIYTPFYVAWVPLAPGELYYGYGYFGPFSINVVNINRDKIKINRVYKNVHVKDAVTVVHRHTFGTSKPVEIKVKENPFLKEKISDGRPEIKPVKATPVPIIREVPNRKQPPPHTRNGGVKKPGERQQFVREKTGSVTPVIREVTDRKAPPSKARNSDVKNQKERHQFAREETVAHISDRLKEKRYGESVDRSERKIEKPVKGRAPSYFTLSSALETSQKTIPNVNIRAIK